RVAAGDSGDPAKLVLGGGELGALSCSWGSSDNQRCCDRQGRKAEAEILDCKAAPRSVETLPHRFVPSAISITRVLAKPTWWIPPRRSALKRSLDSSPRPRVHLRAAEVPPCEPAAGEAVTGDHPRLPHRWRRPLPGARRVDEQRVPAAGGRAGAPAVVGPLRCQQLRAAIHRQHVHRGP